MPPFGLRFSVTVKVAQGNVDLRIKLAFKSITTEFQAVGKVTPTIVKTND